ncbi:MAG: phage holin family protein [Rhodoferax sp.]|uniref:phage holin family protein n=1 Tax=Rhodoferax sp. TaxID=50421 RepID=UPI003BB496A2|nr:phage holin family protein [Rhodoferax sp.]
MAGAGSGLFGQLQHSLGSALELAQVRLALLGTELGLEKQRLAAGLLWGAAAFISLTVALVLLCGFVILLLWDGYRLAAVGVLALLFGGAGGLLLRAAQRRLGVGSKLFEASLAELARDRASVTSSVPNDSP